MLDGWRRTETRRGGEWTVQPVSASQAAKDYVCPGCGRAVVAGTAHLVAWRADGVMGDAADLARTIERVSGSDAERRPDQ